MFEASSELASVMEFGFYPTAVPVSTGMGDRHWTGIPSRYFSSQLCQLSLASLRGR